jgi:hypothetical protein
MAQKVHLLARLITLRKCSATELYHILRPLVTESLLRACLAEVTLVQQNCEALVQSNLAICHSADLEKAVRNG